MSATGQIGDRRGRRLNSWKAIAQFLDRDVRSVQRWEHERALPVHRLPGEKGGAVFAYEGELEQWLLSRSSDGLPLSDGAAAPAIRPSSRDAAIQTFVRFLSQPLGLVTAGVLAAAVIAVVFVTFALQQRVPKVAAVAASGTPRSIAVLPMLNLSGDPAQDYFADGFTEELTTELSQIHSLRVISRTSTMIYKGSRKPLPAIARSLNARYVLEGSVARIGQRVRVIAQLIDAASDTHVSARKYDADVKDVLDVQARISSAIAADVRLDLSPREKARLASSRIVDPQAHDLYLKASYLFARQTPDSIRQSLALYEAAAAKSPTFALAYAGIAQAEYALMTVTAQSPAEGELHIKIALAKALALDPHLADARGMLADLVYWRDWDWPEAEREYRLALADGAQSQTHRRFGADLVTRGRFAEGMSHLQTALEMDPLGMSPRMSLFFGLYFQHKFVDARRATEQALLLNPDFLAGHVLRGLAAAFEKDCSVTTAEAAWVGLHFPSPLADFESALASACHGDNRTARQFLTKMSAAKGTQYVTLYQLALGYAAIHDNATALSYLERSAAAREGQVTYLKVEPMFDSLRSDPAYGALEKRIGLSD